ncbi:hypothetical protein CCACVL1_07265, partial [Corchorus capsularis]
MDEPPQLSFSTPSDQPLQLALSTPQKQDQISGQTE